MRIAIPTNFPGGLEAKVSNHFGECDVFTIVEIDSKHPIPEQSKIIPIENVDHFNCGIIILRLKKAETDVIILNKIGPTPLEIIQKEKIPVYAGKGTVLQVLHDFLKNRLSNITDANICPGKYEKLS